MIVPDKNELLRVSAEVELCYTTGVNVYPPEVGYGQSKHTKYQKFDNHTVRYNAESLSVIFLKEML